MLCREPLHTPLLCSENTLPLFPFHFQKSPHFYDFNKELYSETKLLSPLWKRGWLNLLHHAVDALFFLCALSKGGVYH